MKFNEGDEGQIPAYATCATAPPVVEEYRRRGALLGGP